MQFNQSVKYEILETDRNILSKDQKYLLDISFAIESGSYNLEDLSVREPRLDFTQSNSYSNVECKKTQKLS